MSDAREELSRRIAGEITLSDDPGATLRKWRTDFDVSQTELAQQLEVSSSVISDYESGRRESPGIGVVRRTVDGLLDIDERRGGGRLRQYARVLSAGFESDIVHDLREYPTAVPLPEFYEAMGEFYRLYGQSTNRALVFTRVTRGESPLVALRVVSPTPNAVVLHGIEDDDLWDHAADLARVDGFSLATSTRDLDDCLSDLQAL